MENNISVWEGEGGSLSEGLSHRMTGTVNQIEWAERIRAQVNGEFDRVAKALQEAALKQSGQDRLDTYTMMLILEEKRGEVLSNERAGDFIHDWQPACTLHYPTSVPKLFVISHLDRALTSKRDNLLSVPEAQLLTGSDEFADVRTLFEFNAPLVHGLKDARPIEQWPRHRNPPDIFEMAECVGDELRCGGILCKRLDSVLGG